MTKLLSLITLLFLCLSSLYANDKDIENIFTKYGINGTLIITSLNQNTTFIHNKQRANQRFSPASTFKIPHTLIALNENVIKDEKEDIKWDKIKRFYEQWNQNQTLQTAFEYSCVWCYQKFAQDISQEKYQDYLNIFNYGNKKIGTKLDDFWLDGSLQISAYEQIDFLKNFYLDKFPISQKTYTITKQIMLDKTNSYNIRAKTGWDGTVGWYVGYVTTQKDTYFFAMNGQISNEQLNTRKEIVIEALKVKNVL